ncbi:ABC transporter substrate-binding protein [Candidatus Liberibacter asiaticus]|uniref:ABC transporter substrate-binding protein n=1 Tax=Liberibacter asiaticus TaxID=34021 RepID=UPI0004E06319|nr:ABC transporter substrate-binding protein [Candidatus Liberibacter asiaticus]BAP26518.1 extracellular solute-binding protein [Candidatus Liberibacter asiaticus str. Ishi-1]
MFKRTIYTYLLLLCGFTEAFSTENTTKYLTLYTDQNQSVMLPIIHSFEERTGVKISPIYTSSIQRPPITQGSPVDVIITKDEMSLALNEDLLHKLPAHLIKKNSFVLKNENKKLMRISFDTQVLAYSTKRIKIADLPKSVFDLTNAQWKKRLSFAPNNISFHRLLNTMEQTPNKTVVQDFIKNITANEILTKYKR